LRVRAEQMILPPSRANNSEMAFPIPRLAPVTITTFPSSLPIDRSCIAEVLLGILIL
jgi:hypothetical protein